MFTAISIIAVTILLISINALYVGAEFATIKARKTRVSQLADEGDWLAQTLLPIKESNINLDNYIAACQLGITASSLVLGAYGQNTVAKHLSELLTNFGILGDVLAQSVSATFVLILFTTLQVIVGELIPKSIALQYPERLAKLTVLPVKWSQMFLKPFIWFFNGSGNLILKLMGLNFDESNSHVHSPNEIELLVTDSHEGGLIDDKERQMLRNTFRLRELTARQVMIPRTSFVTGSYDASVVEVLTKALDAGFSRIPIYKESIDNIVGFVHIKDLFSLYIKEEKDFSKILRDVIYVPETSPVLDVWQKLNTHYQYMAIVFDEYGGTAGLVTFEDLLEEIFGELQDEFDQEMALIQYDDTQKRTYLRADLLISDVNEYLNLGLPEDDLDTLGGLVFSLLGRPPEEGDEVTINDLSIRVEKVDDMRITEISFELATGMTLQVGEWEVAHRE